MFSYIRNVYSHSKDRLVTGKHFIDSFMYNIHPEVILICGLRLSTFCREINGTWDTHAYFKAVIKEKACIVGLLGY